jgi:hypothetical protein
MATIITRAGKGSPLENDEVDANFTNLNNNKVETSALNELVDDRVSTLIVPGLGITTDYDDTAGTLTVESDTIEELCKNGTGSTILKGTPVYQTGTAGNFMEIAPADASSAATMPAVGVLAEDLIAGAEGTLLLMGRISGIDTSAFSEGDVIYVASGGGYTNTRPTGESVLVQNLGRVTKVNASNGGGVVMGSGRSNDVPNLTDGNIFIGNASGTYDKRAIVAADISDLTATATELNYTDGVTSSIQTQLDSKAPLASPTFTGTVTADGLSLGDNEKATFGNSNDLEIYHDGSSSYVEDVGAGNLILKSNGSNIQFRDVSDNITFKVAPNATELYYAANKKLATTATGIDVTGTVTSDDKIFIESGNPYIAINDTDITDLNTMIRTQSGVGYINTINDAYNTVAKRIGIDHATGDISFYEDTGTTAKFFWDASAESLGIGTTNPTHSLHIEKTGTQQLKIVSTTSSTEVRFGASSTGAGFLWTQSADPLAIGTDGTERMRIDSSGNVGIGTTSPAYTLDVSGDARFYDATGNSSNYYFESDHYCQVNITSDKDASAGGPYNTAITANGSNGNLELRTNSLQRVSIDQSGNVGIGTTSPDETLHVQNSGNPTVRIETTGASNYSSVHFADAGGASGRIEYQHSNDSMQFRTNASERMRIDANGNLLVGTTDADTQNNNAGSSADNGLVYNIGSGGYFNVARYNGTVGYFNRTGTDGSIVEFRKDGTTVGIIGVDFSDNIFISGNSTHAGIIFGDTQVVPYKNGNTVNNVIDLGSSTANFKDLYLSGTASVSKTRLTTNNTTYWDLRRDSGTGDFVVSDDGLGDVLTILQSNGNVGIGTSSPSRILHVENNGLADLLLRDTSTYSVGTGPAVIFQGNDSGGTITQFGAIYGVSNGSNSGELTFETRNSGSSAERMRIDSSGNVGIGTSSPDQLLHISASSNPTIRIENTDTTASVNQTIGKIEFEGQDASTNASGVRAEIEAEYGGVGGTSRLIFKTTNESSTTLSNSIFLSYNTQAFYTGNTERMRIDSNGNLLVGKTSADNTTAGMTFYGSSPGAFSAVRALAVTGIFNRLSNDGDILEFRKDGTTVGSILNDGTAAYFNSTADGGLARAGTVYFKWSSAQFYPNVDDSSDLGIVSRRFDDIYATNATIQTSDANEKQDIESLSDAEQRVAVAAKGLLRKFRWKSAVEEKGDDARIHFGIIAQDLQAAFEVEGLDAGRYAMFIHSTWTDEETGEERSRMGVRYSELLAFIIAAL